MMKSLLALSLTLTVTRAFMFDQLSNGLRCKGITMLCPPMCLKQDAHGCSTCDCTHIDPSHPKIPVSGNTGSYIVPSNPLNGHNAFPGSTQCDDWTKCACVPTVNAETGCLECPCGNSPVSSLTFPTLPPTIQSLMSTHSKHTSPLPSTGPSISSSLPHTSRSRPQSTSNIPITAERATSTETAIISSENQPSTRSSSIGGLSASSLSFSIATPLYLASISTSKPVTSSSTIPRSPSVTSTNIDTNLPSIATTPSPNHITTLLSTSTLAPFVCPGVFSCSLDCYAGFAMDKNECPQCKCSPIPTDLP